MAFFLLVPLLPGYLLVKFSVGSLGFVMATEYLGSGPEGFQMFHYLLFSMLILSLFSMFTLSLLD